MGARFAKWRAVIAIGDGLPSRGCIEANAHALARYAALCQEAGLVPVVEPEVLMAGEHTHAAVPRGDRRRPAQRVRPTARATRHAGGDDPEAQHGAAGTELCHDRRRWTRWPTATVTCLRTVVPAAVPGIAFLSGGQSGELASARLNAMNVMAKSRRVATAVAAGVFVRARHPAAGLGDLAAARTPTSWRRSRRSPIVRAAIGPRCTANTAPRWSAHEPAAKPRLEPVP